MTVNTTNITSGPYPGNDVTDTFSYTFRIENKNQVRVFETDDAGVQTELTVDTDYTVNTVGDDAGGTITRVAGALPTGFSWYIRSNYQSTQLTSFVSQGAFFPAVHEAAMDKLTFLIQQINDELGRAFKLSESYPGTASAELPDPEALKFVRWNAAGDALENVFGTTSAVASDVASDGASNVQNDLNTRIRSFTNVAALRASVSVTDYAATQGYTSAGDSGSAFYWYDAADTTTADDGFLCIVASDGGRWKLNHKGVVNVKQAGANGISDYTALISALSVSGTLSGNNTIVLPAGIQTVSDTISIEWVDKLTLTGATPESLVFSSVGTITGSAGSWSVPLTVAASGGAETGHFLRLTGATGTGVPEIHEGVWEVTNVAGSVITVTNTARNASFPTHTLTGVNISLIKTVLQAAAKNVVQLYGGNIVSDNIVYQITGSTPLDGTKAFAIAPRANASENNYSNASAKFGSNSGFTGAGNHGLVVAGTAWAELAAGAGACGNSQDGFHATEGASMFGKFTVANGNGESGVMTEMNADAEMDGITCCGNADHGVESISGKVGIAQSTTKLSYNLKQGVQAQDGAVIRAANSVCDFNNVGMKAETGGKIIAPSSTCDNNTAEGFFATRFSYIDAEGSTSTNNGTGYRSERKSLVDALGTLTVSGNSSDYSASFGGDIAFASNDWFPKDLAGWVPFPSTPQLEGVTFTDNGSSGEYKVIQRTVFWKITLAFTTLDTADISPVIVSEMPVTMAARRGSVQMNIRSTTGIIMVAGDTYQANYNTSNDRIVLVDSAGVLMTYNGGQMQAAGTIELSGWYES